MQATYTKLKNGDWGVRVPTESVSDGQSVVVAKKSGETKTEIIARVLWRGNGVALCAIEKGARTGSYSSIGTRRDARMARTNWTGCSCGSIEGRPRPSDCASCQHDY
jgi:hypothetical protein